MRAVIQRVKEASVKVEGEIISSIGAGMLVLLCIEKGDTVAEIQKAAEKTVKLRFFEDQSGKMNRSIGEVSGEMLVVSQFTLASDLTKGLRPGFDRAETPEKAEALVRVFSETVEKAGIPVMMGRFGAMMDVTLVNDGPVTFVLEDKNK